MAQVLSLSVKGTKQNPIVAYFREHFDEDLERWANAEDLLKQELYDKMDEIVTEGRRIIQREKALELMENGGEAAEVIEELEITEERFIEIRDNLEEEDLI